MLVLTCPRPFSLFAQQETPYILNGTAIAESCNCYRLTVDQNWMAGSVWNKNKINLTGSFNYIFNVYLGCKDLNGADGIVFILQPIGTSLGTAGQGLGFQDISPSIGIPIDTYQNFDFNDPPFDHIGIYKNGDLVNGTGNTLAGPVPATVRSYNIEDCKWHTLRIIWDATAMLLSAEVDGVLRVQTNTNLVKDVFNGDPNVYWGFSASTGGQNNIQKFCTSLNPAFSVPADEKTCAPALVSFTDSSTSFGSIIHWWWDFGDGSSFTGQNPPPHAYPTSGNYTIRLNIEGNNGCYSDTLKRMITIGSIPEARFRTTPAVFCANNDVLFMDSSTVEFGTINQWNWNFNKGAELIQMTQPGLRKSFPLGPLHIELVAQTKEGCISEPFTKTLEVSAKPKTSITVPEAACYGDPVPLNAGNLTPAIPIHQWYWFTGDGNEDSSARTTHYYPAAGEYTVGVYALNYAGCSSDTATSSLIIYQTRAKTGSDTIVAFGQPLQLNATGGDYYQWIPGIGLNNPNIADPVATLYNDMTYTVKAYTPFGCPTFDTILVKAYKGPAFYVPNAFTPDNNGINDRFHPVAVGMSRIEFFEVFNRLGQRVYGGQGTSPGWDGTYNGKPQPVGAYMWIIKGQDYLGKKYNEKGTVVLIR
jgi:gliding motility-associated-like protein